MTPLDRVVQTPVDRLIQRWRMRRAVAHIPPGARLLDIGSDDEAILLRHFGNRENVGIDPNVRDSREEPFGQLVRGMFPADLPDDRPFDAITLLAVLEHIPRNEQKAFAEACADRLVNGGVLVMTVPSPQVDKILAVLMGLRLMKGMSVDQHYGFDPDEAIPLFTGAGLRLKRRIRFQLRVNNVFVFVKGGVNSEKAEQVVLTV